MEVPTAGPRGLDLRGTWRAVEADDDVRRHGIDLDADDHDWVEIDVPGHWQHHPKFATSDGPIMYRKRFEAQAPAHGDRRWVTLDGIFYQADVWLDGAYLGDPEGYFFPHTFEITALSGLSDHHVLAVEATCAPQGRSHRRNLTGVFQGGDGIDRAWNPGGLWRTAYVYDTGPVRIDRFRVLCRDADLRRAHIRLGARVDSDVQRPITVRTSRDGEVIDEQTQVVAAGLNEFEWGVDVLDPELWWPRALGAQTLTELAVEIEIDGQRSDRRHRRTGLRQADWDGWTCSINGERLFVKGANLAPSRPGLADAEDQLVIGDLERAVDLGLDAVRVRGHIADRRLYDRADELGLLILQDFPLQWGHARSTRGQAVTQAREAVDALGHHPSVIRWSAHNDPTVTAEVDAEGGRWRRRLRGVTAQQLPSWNKSVLDRWVKRSFERSDPTRSATAHSGVAPHLPQLNGTDSHLWLGWRSGDADDLGRLAARLPRLVRFVSEFGAHSVPSVAPVHDTLAATEDWPHLDWERWEREAGYDRATFERWFPPEDYATFEQWAASTQHYQAHVLKTQIETLRRLKYRPTGGFCFSTLIDPAPAVSPSVLDHRREPKAAYDVVRRACAPLIVVGTTLPDWVSPGDRIDMDVHAINDHRNGFAAAEVHAVVSWAGGSQRFRFGGDIDADSVVKVGRIRLEVPDTLGELAVALSMDADGHHVDNRYTTAITLPPGE